MDLTTNRSSRVCSLPRRLLLPSMTIIGALILAFGSPAPTPAAERPESPRAYASGEKSRIRANSALLAKKAPDRTRRYQWLFGKESAQKPQSLEAAAVLEEFDREVKQARKLYLSGDTEKAILKYRSSIDRFESLVDAIPPGNPLLQQMEGRFQVFDELATKILGPVEVEPDTNRASQVFYLMEKRRICRRNLTLKKAGVVEFFDVPQPLRKAEAQILTKLMEIRHSGAGAAEQGDEDTLRQKLATVRKSLQKSSPRYALLRSGRPIPLGEVRSELLKKDEMILDFNIFRDRLVVGIITAEGAAYHQMPADQAEIDKSVFRLQRKLRESTLGSRSSFMGHAWKEPSRRVYRTLLGRLPPLPATKTTIFVIPDRSLWYLPLSMLLDAEDRPFGGDKLVSLIPSADMLRFVRLADRRSAQARSLGSLLLFESLPWASEEDIKEAMPERFSRKKTSQPISEGERIERLILTNPVYPRPSDIVLKIQKMFKRLDVWVGPTATIDHLIQYRGLRPSLTVMAIPLAMTDMVTPERQPSFFFSPDKRGRRRLEVRRLFETPLSSPLIVLPTCWFDLPAKDSPLGEGPLLLSTALFYAGMPMGLVNYSNPDWGDDDPFLLAIFDKVAGGVPPGKALAEYTRMMPAGLDSSFSGRPPAWSGWIVFGDPGP